VIDEPRTRRGRPPLGRDKEWMEFKDVGEATGILGVLRGREYRRSQARLTPGTFDVLRLGGRILVVWMPRKTERRSA
jgi:hypothetical protein